MLDHVPRRHKVSFTRSQISGIISYQFIDTELISSRVHLVIVLEEVARHNGCKAVFDINHVFTKVDRYTI